MRCGLRLRAQAPPANIYDSREIATVRITADWQGLEELYPTCRTRGICGEMRRKKWKVLPWPENLPFLFTTLSGSPRQPANNARPEGPGLSAMQLHYFFFFAFFFFAFFFFATFFFSFFFATFFFAFFLFAIIYHLLSA